MEQSNRHVKDKYETNWFKNTFFRLLLQKIASNKHTLNIIAVNVSKPRKIHDAKYDAKTFLLGFSNQLILALKTKLTVTLTSFEILTALDSIVQKYHRLCTKCSPFLILLHDILKHVREISLYWSVKDFGTAPPLVKQKNSKLPCEQFKETSHSSPQQSYIKYYLDFHD